MFRKTLLLTLLLALFIAGCAPATEVPVSAAITLTDGLGRPVVMNGAAQRIISLAPSNTEILFAVGAGAQVIGRDAYSDYPAEALDVADIGDTYAGLNTELIVSLKPDLILAAEINTGRTGESARRFGVNCLLFEEPKYVGRNVYQP